MRNRYFQWIIAIALFTVSWIFASHYIKQTAQTETARFFKEALGLDLTYETLEETDTGWRAVDVRLTGCNQITCLALNHVTLSYDLNLWKRQLTIDVAIPALTWDANYPLSIQKIAAFDDNRWFSIAGHLHIEEGLILAKDQEQLLQLDARLSHDLGVQIEALMQDQEGTKTAHILAAKGPQGWTSSWNLQQMPFEHAALFLQPFLEGLNEWSISSGTANGSVEWSSKDQAKGMLRINDLSVNHPAGTTAYFQELALSLDQNFLSISKGKISTPKELLEQIEGGLHLKENAYVLDLHGVHINEAGRSNFEAAAVWHPRQKEGLLEGTFNFQDSSSMGWRLAGASNGEQRASFSLKQFGKRESALITSLLGPSIPLLHDFQWNKGKLNLEAELILDKGQIATYSLQQLLGIDVHFDILPWKAHFQADLIQGSLHTKAASFNDFLSADIAIKNGALLTDKTVLPFDIDQIHADLHVASGRIARSSFEADLAGLKGVATIDWNQHQPSMHFEFRGEAHDLKPILPDTHKDLLLSVFGKDSLALTMEAKPTRAGVSLIGALNIFQGDAVGEVFDFDAIVAFSHTNSGIGVPHLAQMQFQGDAIPLKKYVQPFALDAEKLRVAGFADVQGFYKEGALDIAYDAHDVVIDHDAYVIEVAEVKRTERFGGAKHAFNLRTGAHAGMIFVDAGKYTLKESGLVFFPVKTAIDIEGMRIVAREMETVAEGIFMTGQIDIDLTDPRDGYFSVASKVDSFFGSVDSVKTLLSRFNKPFFFLKLPVQGMVSFKDSSFLNMSFAPDDYTVATCFSGQIQEGTAGLDALDWNLQELKLDFAYDHAANRLAIDEVQGALFVGHGNRIEEYALTDSHLIFSDYQKGSAEFELTIHDGPRELLKLKGETKPNESRGVVVALDKELTHFGILKPEQFSLSLKDAAVDSFSLKTAFELKPLFTDLVRFSRTGLFFLPRNLLARLQEIKEASGSLALNLSLDPATSALNIHLDGTDVSIDDQRFKEIVLHAKSKGSVLSIDQLQLDQLSFAADAAKQSDGWKCNFIGIKWGQSLLAGLQGTLTDSGNFIGKVNLFEANLDELANWPAWQDALGSYGIKGRFKAQGTLEADLSGRIESILTASLRQFSVGDLQFKDAHQLSCHFNSSTGLSLRHLDSALQQDGRDIALLRIERFHVDHLTRDIELDSLRFSIPAIKLPHTAALLGEQFSNIFTPSLQEIISSLKREGNVAGSFDFETAGNRKAFKLNFQDDLYNLLGDDRQLSGAAIEFDPFEFKATALYTYHDTPYAIQARADARRMDQTEITVHPLLLSKSTGTHSPLTIKWADEAVQSIEGELPGLKIAFRRDKEGLLGTVAINGSEILPLIKEEYREGFSDWQIGSGYYLNGRLHLPSFHSKEQMRFTGSFEGDLFQLKGFEFHRMQSSISITADAVHCQDLIVHDPALTCSIEQIELLKNRDDTWMTIVPQIKFNDFRPALLQDLVESNSARKQKALLIQTIDIANLEGLLGESGSFTGAGSLTFNNVSRKHTQNILFSIPGEILTRLGLDLSMMTPVSGAIMFSIGNGKIALTGFQDVYSEGKISKFYLADENSHIDFDGNINVLVRLKQSNVLLKIAELFTIGIQGTIKKPLYSIQRPKELVER